MSLFCAESEMTRRCVILYGDIIFDTAVLEKLLKSPGDISLVVDLSWQDHHQGTSPKLYGKPDLVTLNHPPAQYASARYLPPEDEHVILKIGQDLPLEHAHGEFIGMAMFSEQGIDSLKRVFRDSSAKYANTGFHEAGTFAKASFTDLIREMIART